MSNYYEFTILLAVAFITCTNASTLRPVDHAKRQGYDFCQEGQTNKKLLKNICVEAAKKEGITNYDPNIWSNLSCKTENLSLDPGTGAQWETKQEDLLTCVFKQGRTQADQQRKSVYGRGLTKFDTFKYTWDQRRKAFIAEGNYPNFLDGIIPGVRAPPVEVGSAHTHIVIPASQAGALREPYDKRFGSSASNSQSSGSNNASGGTMSSGSLPKFGGR